VTRRRVAGLAGLVLLVALGGWGYHWWTNPHLLEGRAGAGSFEYDPRPLASGPSYQAVTYPDVGGDRDETIVLKSVTAHFTTNSARATVAFWICTTSGDLIGLAHGENTLGESCERVRPVKDGTKLHLGAGEPIEYVVMALTPTRPGTVEVDAVTFDYKRSWKHLHQHGTETFRGRIVDHLR